ncbi:hypothetical protein NSQ90_15205 [Paenibacillus sp. FSL H7-0737]|uniref:hypothetical protein n=1 Tax=Paenibacillus sp. FSL H7-0737 TaxID=1536775 RepID=UPI0004F595BB|nr:hypothetical protein [Paenibacillus sp. FSL H7-0737]AIQ24109.1 hypothetical protein H70737_15330 [Paenibacillus sp. FSL H7-0737]
MLENLYRRLSAGLLLILALCATVFIGKETVISIVTITLLLAELGISFLLLKKREKLHVVLISAMVAEGLYLLTREFWLLALSILLLIVAGIWRGLFGQKVRSRVTPLIVVRKVLISIAALIVTALWGIGIYAKPITTPVALPTDAAVTIDERKLDSAAVMLKDIEVMNSFGSRTTGSEGHNQFISWLEQQVTDMGLKVYRDHYTFDRWEEKSSSLMIDQQSIHVSSAFPYSGETDENGVTGELVYTKRGEYDQASGKIAVIEIENFRNFPSGIVMNMRDSSPMESQIAPNEGDLVLTTALKEAKLEQAKEMGVKAVVVVWKGVSDDKVEKQYVPFTTDYAGIPAIWVNETEGKKVINAAQKHKEGTVILEAEIQKNAPTESFYVKIDGKNKDEAIIINTHTDGINVVEENGAVGMLSMIRYLQQEQPERTMIFTFVTGHFRLPDFKGTSQATSTWMEGHRELWDGKKGHMKAVAGITVEHLGSMEWKDDDTGHYRPTGKISTEYTYAGNEMMASIWLKAIEKTDGTRTVLLHGHNKFEFGESQPLFEAGIPVIGFIPMPDYLLVDSENREMDKFDAKLMHTQIVSLLKVVKIVDGTETTKLGKSDGYSFFYGRTK